jgi:hypothetical protein
MEQTTSQARGPIFSRGLGVGTIVPPELGGLTKNPVVLAKQVVVGSANVAIYTGNARA